MLSPFKDKPTQAIEIGSFEGMSASFFCDHILTHQDSHLDCVDPYVPYDEQKDMDTEQALSRFLANTKEYGSKITLHRELSSTYLKSRTQMADIIYIDGSHRSDDCLIDAIQAHLLLNPGGILIFDDYLWDGMIETPVFPKTAINAFMTCFCEKYKLLSIGYQVLLKKI